MGTVKIKFKTSEFRKLLTGPEVTKDITERTRAIAEAAGEGFEATIITGGFGGGRTVGVVHTATAKARRAQAEDKTLSKAIDAGR